MTMVRAFYPSYYKRFKCIEDKCESNCCKNWGITVTKSEYEKYLNVEDEDLRQHLKANIQIFNEEPFEAKISLDSKGRCVFNEEGGLCYLQLKKGHDFLTKTCRAYPRVFRMVGSNLETFLRFSCEAVIDNAFVDASIMKFEEGSLDVDESFNFSELKTNIYTSSEKGIDIFWHLRSASIFIVQHRQYKLWERMVLLGLFAKQADILFFEGKEESASFFAQDFIAKVEQGFYNDYIKSLPIVYEKAVETMAVAINELLPKLRNLYDTLTKMMSGLGLSENSQSTSVAVDNFASVLKNYYLPFFEHKEHIFEHCIVNSILMDGFPFSYNDKKESIYDNYYKIAIKFGLLKFEMVGLAGYYKDKLDHKMVVVEIADFLKRFDHIRDGMELINSKLKQKDLTALGIVAALFKDWQ